MTRRVVDEFEQQLAPMLLTRLPQQEYCLLLKDHWVLRRTTNMPPRRSTRSASVQPPPVEKPIPSKRKRGQPAEEEVLTDHVNTKPPSRTRKPPSRTASSTAKAKGRARSSLEDVPESDIEEDEEGSPPPMKKTRPSLGDDDEYEVEEDIKPVTRKVPARKQPVSRGGRSSVVKKELVAEEEDVKPTVRNTHSRLSSATTKPSARTSGRATRGKAKKEESSEVEEIPVKHEIIEISDDSSVEEISAPLKPTRRPRGKAAQGVRRSATPVSQPPSAQPSGRSSDPLKREESQDPQSPLQANSAIVPAAPVPDDEDSAQEVTSVNEEKEDAAALQTAEPYEEEHSLLDDIRPPSPKLTTQPAIPEEPQGPKPRLVIHKMALVNFKSYAGRQEIGPFHKVKPFLLVLFHGVILRIGFM